MNEILSYYQTHSPMTDPEEYGYLYDDLPDDLEGIFKVIHNVLMHHDDAEDRYQPTGMQRREKFLEMGHKGLG